MKQFLNRFVVAAGLAGLLAFSVGVPVFAQYGPMPYDGPFYWLSDNRAYQGLRWYESPRRGWSTSGDPWSALTSFPERIWEFPVLGAPPNDSCYVVPFLDPIDPDFGPFGLQVNQYMVEWWEGTTYLSHPGKPAGWTEAKFGFFDFDPRGDRPAVGPRGLPGGFVGQSTGEAGACVAKLLAEARGSGEPWKAAQEDAGGGGPCMAWPAIYRLRANIETRCEPDLSFRDDEDYTLRFYEIWDRYLYSVPILLPDGASVRLRFPDDYPAGDAGAGARVWLRRADVGLNSWVNAGDGPYAADFPSSAVFAPGPADGGGGGSDYRQYHEWRLDAGMSANERRASARNVLKTYNADGEVISDTVTIHDLLNDTEDCLSLDLASYEGTQDIDWTQGCGRVNSVGLAGSSLQTGGERYSDLGAASPAEVVGMLTEATVPGAVGNRQPAPPGDSFWLEYDTWAMACHAGFFSERDLPLIAAETIDDHWERFELEWDEYLRLERLTNWGMYDRDALMLFYEHVSRLRGMLEGWIVIYAYRDMVHGELLAAVEAAGYVYGGAGFELGVDFNGTGCEQEMALIQPLLRVGGGVDVAPPNAGTASGSLLSFEDMPNSERFTEQQVAEGLPHYIGGSSLSFPVSAASHYVRDNSMRAGSSFPTGPTHWDGVDVIESSNMFVAMACGKPQENRFAPEVERFPSYGYWASNGDWVQFDDLSDPDQRRLAEGVSQGGGAAFDSRTLASYTECADDAFGDYGDPDGPRNNDCYASAEMASRVAEYSPGGAETLTQRAVATHREAVESGAERGMYKYAQMRDQMTENRSPVFSDVIHRQSSGDVDESGVLIEHDSANFPGRDKIGRPTSYAVEMVDAPHALLLAYNPTFTGFDDLDHLSSDLPQWFSYRDYYWGVAPGTAVNGPPGTIAEADMEYMTRSGPARLFAAMGYARGAGIGSCTLCSENGCDDTVIEEFSGERFTSSVTQGTAVCLIGPTPLEPPAHSCPTVGNVP